MFEQHGIEVVIDTTNGKSYMTQGMLARLVNKRSNVISYHFQKCKVFNDIKLKAAQVQTRGGLQGVQLFGEDYIILAIAKYAPDLLPKLTQAGLRVFLQHYILSLFVLVANYLRCLEKSLVLIPFEVKNLRGR